MHTYSKDGSRQSKLQNDKKVKKGIKGFYARLGQIGILVDHLKTLDVVITEDNIQEVVNPLIGRDLDNMEKMIILAKLDNGNNTE